MHIWDNRNRSWLAVTAGLSLALVGLHAWLGRREPRPLGGASTPGLWLGVLASVLMLYVGLVFVALRQRDRRLRTTWARELGFRTAALLLAPLRLVPAWHTRPRAWWLRAHVWMGLFSVVVVLCHSGYRWGGWLTASLWVILILLLISGLIGLLLQQFLPRALMVRFPAEAPYGQIPHLRRVAAGRAAELLRAVSDPQDASGGAEQFAAHVAGYFGGAKTFAGELELETYFQGVRLRSGRPRLAEEERRDRLAELAQEAGPKWDAKRVNELLEADPPQDLCGKLEVVSKALAPPQARELAQLLRDRWLDDLEALCRQGLEWDRQELLYHWLHGWLLVHIPLSVSLLVLVVAHIVAALYY